MLSESLVGHEFRSTTAVVEPGRLRFFHKAIGETNPRMTSPDSPIPPTYLFCLEMMDAENPFGFVEEIGLSISEILHAEQGFEYLAPVFIGDHVTFRPKVSEIVQKKNGALTFVVQDVAVTNQGGVPVAKIRRSFVIKNR
jgi:hypothetical protein